MDQVPFNLDLLPKRTWGEEKDTTVSSCGAGSTQRYGTLQVCVHGNPQQEQPRIGIIFRGKGKIAAKEKAMYHEPPANLAVMVYGLQV